MRASGRLAIAERPPLWPRSLALRQRKNLLLLLDGVLGALPVELDPRRLSARHRREPDGLGAAALIELLGRWRDLRSFFRAGSDECSAGGGENAAPSIGNELR